VLDVGCGAGRHAAALLAAGARPVGLDLSAALLRRARSRGVPLVRADMRALPVRPRSMDLVVNLFTSFGYFDDDAVHARVLAGAADCLVPGGWFVMDFLHADSVRNGLVPEEEQLLGGKRVHVTRALEDGGLRVVKTMQVAGGKTFVERVRLFAPSELEAMFAAAGLKVAHRFGDYDGGPLRPGSPRAILMASRPA